jgi:hypothetical protein
MHREPRALKNSISISEVFLEGSNFLFLLPDRLAASDWAVSAAMSSTATFSVSYLFWQIHTCNATDMR